MFFQMDEERYTWIERDNHHVCRSSLICSLHFLKFLRYWINFTKSQMRHQVRKKKVTTSTGACWQTGNARCFNTRKYCAHQSTSINPTHLYNFLQELQRISADNSRLHRALNRIKPTVPSLKEVEIRTKDLERWYKNGCKLPDVLYDNTNSNSPVAERALPTTLSPSRHARSFAQRGYGADTEISTSARNIPVLKQMMQANKNAQHVPAASPKRVAAGREFDSNKSLMGRMRPELLCEVCDVKQPPAALRQLLQAACSALGRHLYRVQSLSNFQRVF